MEASTVPQVEKREYKNQTAGWLGVVTIDPRGEERGVSIEPHGTVWLSDAEAILTARAPRRPEDNPFVEQTFVGVDENGTRQDFKMAPLVPADTDPRYVPTQDRYVPPPPSTPAESVAHAVAGAQSDATVTSPEAAAAEKAILASPPVQGAVAGSAPLPGAVATPQPPSTGSAATQPPPAPAADPESWTGIPGGEAPLVADQRASWTEDPVAPGEVISGNLSGSNEPAPQEQAATAPDPTTAPQGASPALAQPPAPHQPPTAPPMSAAELAGEPPAAPPAAESAAAAAPEPPVSAPSAPAPVAEEHAAAVDPSIGEETGAARPPEGQPVEGEFAAREEVGSPDAPAANEQSTAGPAEG